MGALRMSKPVLKLKPCVAALLASVAFAQSASAEVVSDPGAYAYLQSIIASIGGTTSAVGTAATAITTSLTTNFSQLIGTIKGTAEVTNNQIAAASKQTSETAIVVATSVEKARIDKMFRVADPCAVAVGGATSNITYERSADGAAIGRGAPRRVGGGTPLPNATPNLRKAIEWAKGDSPAPSPEIQAKVAAAGACGTFVAAAGNNPRALACQKIGANPANQSGYENADISADTIFAGPQKDPSRPTNRLTVDLSATSPERTAVEAYSRNLETPLDFRTLEKGEANTDAGRRFLAMKDIYESRLSMSNWPRRRHLSSIAATTATIEPVKQMLESSWSRDHVQERLNLVMPQWSTKGISQDELMELEVSRRYRNLEWAKYLVANREEVPLEQAQLQAVVANQNQMILRELREMNILMGAMLNQQVRAEFIPQLSALHRSATTR